MNEQIQILSVNGYMKKYAVDGIGKGADRWQVKRDMLDEFRREIFDTAMFRLGSVVFSDEWEGNEEERKTLENIIDNANKKWRSICREFAKYRETSGLLKEEDLQEYLEDRMDISKVEDDEEDGIATARMATEEEIEQMMPAENMPELKTEEE